jgi:hypothetical protein
MEVLLTTSDWAVGAFLIPLVDIVLGIVGAIFFVPSAQGDIPLGVLIGIIIGLSASGLYSGSKNMAQGIRNGNGNGDGSE